MIKVGIPRALWYFKYFPLWEGFFRSLGAEVIVSPRTNKDMLDQGIKLMVDEACLPLKVYFGHLNYLKDKTDYLFCPRLVSVARKEYTCPKFMGIPDSIYPNIKDLPAILGPTINFNRNKKEYLKIIWEVGSIFTKNPMKIAFAWRKALQEYYDFRNVLQNGKLPKKLINLPGCSPEALHIAVIGHEYLIYDPYLSMNLLAKLVELNLNPHTPQMLSAEIINKEIRIIPKRIFWTSAKDLMGSCFHFSRETKISGLILVSAFGCGPDAITQSLIAHFHKNYAKKPVLVLTIDEHSGEAGINTRLEAFADLLKRKVV